MPGGLLAHPCATRDGPDHMTFQGHRQGRGRRTRELRIEQSRDSIGALRRKIRAGIEQTKISRIRHLNNAMFHARDRPAQCLFERLRRAEVEALQFDAEILHIEHRRDRPGLDAFQGLFQLERQPAADSRTVRRVRKQRRNGIRQWLLIQAAAPRAWSRSARMSSMCSMPTLNRILPGVTPAASCSCDDIWRCVVDAGWHARDFASPKFTNRLNSLSAL